MTPDDHFRHLAEFIRGVELAGGTTPHVAMTVESMSRLDDDLEKLWFAGCYALTYNWPAAERLFLENPHGDPDLGWLEEHWDGIPLRKERKAVFRKPYFQRSAMTYYAFALDLVDASSWPETYEGAFDALNVSVFGMGRYIAIRWLEVMRRAFPDRCTGWVMPSILSDGGQHPRKMLAMIYPEESAALLGGNTPRELRVSDNAAARLKLDLELSYGLKTNPYEMQSLLCEVKQAINSRRHYPGRSIDSEMDYFTKVYHHWGEEKRDRSSFWSVRAACFPEWSLGEQKARWWGTRPELNGLIADHGIVWSDYLYDYAATKEHNMFAEPIYNNVDDTELLP